VNGSERERGRREENVLTFKKWIWMLDIGWGDFLFEKNSFSSDVSDVGKRSFERISFSKPSTNICLHTIEHKAFVKRRKTKKVEKVLNFNKLWRCIKLNEG
jgi:hypothetical protein